MIGFPWVLLAGVVQQSYWKFFPLKGLFSGPQFWDRITVIDLYVILISTVFAIGYAFGKLKFDRVHKISNELITAILLLMAAGLLQIFFQTTYEPVLSTPAEYFRSMIVFPILMVLLIYKTIDFETVDRMVSQFLLMAGIFSIFALFQYITGIFPGERADFMDRLTWPFIDFLTLKATSANWVAFFITPAVIIGFIQLVKDIRKRKLTRDLIIHALCLAVSTIVLFLTQSYGAYVAVFASIALFLFRSLKIRNFAIAFSVLLLAGGALFFLQRDSYKYKVLSGEKDYRFENSAESRKDIYVMNIEMLKKNVFMGVGLNQYQSYFAAHQEDILGRKLNESHIPPHAHNFFLSFWLSLGFPALLAMGVLITGLFIAMKFDKNNPAVFALLAIMIHGLIDSYYWKQEIAYIFWLMIAFSYLHRTVKHSQKEAIEWVR